MATVKFCIACGEKLPERAAFCSSCGESLNISEEDERASQKEELRQILEQIPPRQFRGIAEQLSLADAFNKHGLGIDKQEIIDAVLASDLENEIVLQQFNQVTLDNARRKMNQETRPAEASEGRVADVVAEEVETQSSTPGRTSSARAVPDRGKSRITTPTDGPPLKKEPSNLKKWSIIIGGGVGLLFLLFILYSNGVFGYNGCSGLNNLAPKLRAQMQPQAYQVSGYGDNELCDQSINVLNQAPYLKD